MSEANEFVGPVGNACFDDFYRPVRGEASREKKIPVDSQFEAVDEERPRNFRKLCKTA